ncbi:methanogen output domain 1-containing protein [Methanomethylovorans sp. PtaU1.Bin093]|uniref:methanogen output domain 1-containing protein n=1 Tax=Methanomethylovorans sp. PtaU1.Bin093 TaxID=1811679 RepID=UPI0025E08150|nr:methanogen output domain 1-containing protein [Methanomethylovorans sp. PtaU1.Bin093]
MADQPKPKVLIVDDEPMNVELLEAYLGSEYVTVSASNGKEALTKVNEEKPDILLLDIMMPEMNGYDVCKLIRSAEGTQLLPVVMVTALSNREDRIRGVEAGADDFLIKPVDKVELTARIRSLLRIKHLHNSLQQEKDKLEMQNRVRSVLTRIIPTLFKTIPLEQKNMIIHQMTNMVVESMLEGLIGYEDIKSKENPLGDACCMLMNQLGGSFESKPNAENHNSFYLKGTRCPWGAQEAQLNPVLCNLTRGAFARLAERIDYEMDVEVLSTMGNGDEQCIFRFSKQG